MYLFVKVMCLKQWNHNGYICSLILFYVSWLSYAVGNSSIFIWSHWGVFWISSFYCVKMHKWFLEKYISFLWIWLCNMVIYRTLKSSTKRPRPNHYTLIWGTVFSFWNLHEEIGHNLAVMGFVSQTTALKETKCHLEMIQKS